MSADLEDNLTWLADRYEVCISRWKDRWQVELYGPEDSHDLGSSLELVGAQPGIWNGLDSLLARAREWAEEPLARDLDGRDWLRLSKAAAELGVPARDLIRRGARELLDRLDSEQASD